MKLRLSEPLEDYFKAANARDVSAMCSAFADDAFVVDEGRRHHGLGAIREWMRGTVERYAFRVDPIESSQRGGDTLVITSVSGTFPGSPISLQYEFRIDDGKVIGLEIR